MKDNSFALPDDLLDKHFGEADTGADDELPVPDADLESPDDEIEDTLDDEPFEDEADTEDEDAGDEPVDEDEPEDEEDAEDTSDEPDAESFLPKFDRKKIEADPELNKAYKHMQAVFTKTQQELAASKREADLAREEVESFVQELSTDEGAENFLIKVAMSRPEVYRRAFERAEELTDDPDELRRFDREQSLLKREAELQRIERERAVAAQERRVAEIENVTKKAASRYQMDDAEMKIVKQYVTNAIYRARSSGQQDVTEEEIVRAVKRAASDLALKKERIQEEAKREATMAERKRIKEKARGAKRPPAPRSGQAPGKRRPAMDVPKGTDGLDFVISKLLDPQ